MVTRQSSEALAERRREAGARVLHPGFSDTRYPWACGPGDTSCLPVPRHMHPQSFSLPRPFQEGGPDGCPPVPNGQSKASTGTCTAQGHQVEAGSQQEQTQGHRLSTPDKALCPPGCSNCCSRQASIRVLGPLVLGTGRTSYDHLDSGLQLLRGSEVSANHREPRPPSAYLSRTQFLCLGGGRR